MHADGVRVSAEDLDRGRKADVQQHLLDGRLGQWHIRSKLDRAAQEVA